MTASKQLQSLLTAAIDAVNGYEEALKQADGRGLSGLFEEMATIHRGHADQLAEEMRLAGDAASYSGSIMTSVNSVIMDIRSVLGGLDSSILPGLIDGETRTIAKYDEVIESGALEAPASTLISQQRSELLAAVSRMQARAGASDAHLVP